MHKIKRILVTGGGSGGHILPVLTVVNYLQSKEKELKFLYVGSGNKLEQDLVSKNQIVYQKISTGKFRRYFDWKNFGDVFRVMKGVFDAWKILNRYQPQVVFSKGGYVSVPVCLVAYLKKIPIVMHESDTVMGLANRVVAKMAKRICTNFDLHPQKEKYKYLQTGLPVRKELFKGSKKNAREKLGFNSKKPVVLIMGGSQGAQFINKIVYQNLDMLLRKMQIIHITGRGKRKLIRKVGYVNFDYVGEDLADFYALTDVIISRAGANALMEIATLGLPNILIPLPSAANNHQLKNAEVFVKQKASLILKQKSLRSVEFVETIFNLLDDKVRQKEMRGNLKKMYNKKAVEMIGGEILRFV